MFKKPVIEKPEKYFLYNKNKGEKNPRKDISEKELEKVEYTNKILNFNGDKRLLKGRKSVIKMIENYQKTYDDEILREISEDLDFPTLRNFLVKSFK